MEDAVADVVGDQIARARRRYRRCCCWRPAAGDKHAVAGVAEGGDAVGVQADEVPLHLVPRRAGIGDQHAVADVARDDVVGEARGAAHYVVGGAKGDEYAIPGISQNGGSGVDTDVVPLHLVPRRAGVGDLHAVAAVAGDDVAGEGLGAAHAYRGAGGAIPDEHATLDIPQVGGARGIGADVVPRHLVPRRAGVGDLHALAAGAGDDVVGEERGAAHRVAGGATS